MATQELGYKHTCDFKGCVLTDITSTESVPAGWRYFAFGTRDEDNDRFEVAQKDGSRRNQLRLLCPIHVLEVKSLVGL